MHGFEDPDRIEPTAVRAGIEHPVEAPVLARGGDPSKQRRRSSERDRRLGFVPGEAQDRAVVVPQLGFGKQA